MNLESVGDFSLFFNLNTMRKVYYIGIGAFGYAVMYDTVNADGEVIEKESWVSRAFPTFGQAHSNLLRYLS